MKFIKASHCNLPVWASKLITRLKVCYRILFRKYDHWIILNLKEKEFINLISDNDFEIDGDYHGMQPYIMRKMIRKCADQNIKETDLLLDRIEFHADVEQHLLQKNKVKKHNG